MSDKWKMPRLFYYEEGVGGYIPAPDRLENIIDVDCLEHGEVVDITFKCLVMTDEEYEDLPDE